MLKFPQSHVAQKAMMSGGFGQRFRSSVPILNPPLLVTPIRIKQFKQLSEYRVPTNFA